MSAHRRRRQGLPPAATAAVLAGLATIAGVASLGRVTPVSAEVPALPLVAYTTATGRPAAEGQPESRITPLPSPCLVQSRRLAETQAALAADTGHSALIEASDAALIAQVLIAQCGWSVEQVLEGAPI